MGIDCQKFTKKKSNRNRRWFLIIVSIRRLEHKLNKIQKYCKLTTLDNDDKLTSLIDNQAQRCQNLINEINNRATMFLDEHNQAITEVIA